MSLEKRKVKEQDFRKEEFFNADPADYEFRGDGKLVRKDRWESAVSTLAFITRVDTGNGFEIPQVIEAVSNLKSEVSNSLLTNAMFYLLRIFFSRNRDQLLLRDAFESLGIDDEHWGHVKAKYSLAFLSDFDTEIVNSVFAGEIETMISGACDFTVNTGELPLYQCHKQVHAFEIGRIEGTLIYPKEEGLCRRVEVTDEFLEKHDLNQEGYLVVYGDGYTSFSPKKAFEEGYSFAPKDLYVLTYVDKARILSDITEATKELAIWQNDPSSFDSLKTSTQTLVTFFDQTETSMDGWAHLPPLELLLKIYFLLDIKGISQDEKTVFLEAISCDASKLVLECLNQTTI